MALVPLTENNINLITYRVEEIVRKAQGTLPHYPNAMPTAVADEAYNLILTKEKEQAIRDALPAWSTRDTEGYYLTINMPHTGRVGHWSSTCMLGYMTTPRLMLYGCGELPNIPGIANTDFNNGVLTLIPEGDGSDIQLPVLRDFVKEVNAINAAHVAVEEEVEKAVNDMRNFLRQHRTLQSAIREFGDALWEYVPSALKTLYEKKTEPRVRKPCEKREKIDIDKGPLIAYATTHKLQLTA